MSYYHGTASAKAAGTFMRQCPRCGTIWSVHLAETATVERDAYSRRRLGSLGDDAKASARVTLESTAAVTGQICPNCLFPSWQACKSLFSGSIRQYLLAKWDRHLEPPRSGLLSLSEQSGCSGNLIHLGLLLGPFLWVLVGSISSGVLDPRGFDLVTFGAWPHLLKQEGAIIASSIYWGIMSLTVLAAIEPKWNHRKLVRLDSQVRAKLQDLPARELHLLLLRWWADGSWWTRKRTILGGDLVKTISQWAKNTKSSDQVHAQIRKALPRLSCAMEISTSAEAMWRETHLRLPAAPDPLAQASQLGYTLSCSACKSKVCIFDARWGEPDMVLCPACATAMQTESA